MRSRSVWVTYMEILGALKEGPKLQTRLAQACGINSTRLPMFTSKLESNGYITIQVIDGHEFYSITGPGLSCLADYEALLAKHPLF